SVIDQNKCNEHGVTSAGNSLELTTTSWMEIQQQELLRSQVDYDLVHEKGRVQGSVTSFGLSGVFSSIDKVQSAIAVAFAPVELKEVIGDTLIQEGSTGSKMGWTWNVLGSEEKAGAPAWRIFMENEDIKDLCLGHAHVTVWAQSGSPWAIFQEVDVRISGHDIDRSECSTTSQLINDLVVPEGSLELRMTLQRSSVERGEKPVIYGRDYDNRPRNSDTKIDDDRIEWGENESHLPDATSRRPHPLEMAVDCIPHLNGASGAKTALSGDGYVFRALDNRTDGGATTWNVSWVDTDDMSGWVRLDVAGIASAENCTYLSSGTYEDGPQHDRSDIPSTPDLAWMEDRFLDSSRYPELSTGDAWIGTSSGFHDDVRYGHLVATAGSGLDQITQWFDFDDGAGAVTVDLSRTWEEGEADNSFTLAADLNGGRIIGWSFSSSI
nr:hypothetical protein [Candidatus Poseidoniaceae archaeon]